MLSSFLSKTMLRNPFTVPTKPRRGNKPVRGNLCLRAVGLDGVHGGRNGSFIANFRSAKKGTAKNRSWQSKRRTITTVADEENPETCLIFCPKSCSRFLRSPVRKKQAQYRELMSPCSGARWGSWGGEKVFYRNFSAPQKSEEQKIDHGRAREDGCR